MFLLIACSAPLDDTLVPLEDPWLDSGQHVEDEEDPDSESEDEEDAAVVLSHTLPLEMSCGEEVAVQVVVRNTGLATWTRDGGYKLGVIDDEDPFYGPDTRVWMSEEDAVPPGGSYAFVFTLSAPDQEGDFVTDWQMVHEEVRWFGEPVGRKLAVRCGEVKEPEGPPPLDELVWLHSDISGWPETNTLSAVTVSDDTICLENDGVHEWPGEYLGGDTAVVGNPWIILEHEGVWYAATWEWLRPGQECKARYAVNGDHIKIPPLDTWSPTSGETYWFMVSGLARFSERNVEARTNLVPVVWP